MRKLLTVLAAITIAAAGSVVAQDVDPVGEWEWVVDADGQVFTGTMDITGEPGAWTGTLTSDLGVADITGLEVDGNLVMLTIDTGQGMLTMEIEVT